MNPGEILISVVIPAYNAERWIARTLESVQAQTHSNLEILVVDDGSRDNSAAIVEQFAACDPRIRLIRQPNGGVARARNTGWRQAKSDYIAFVDADDLWTPDKTERQLALLLASAPEVALIYSRYVMIDADDRVSYRWDGPPHDGWVFDTLLSYNFIGNGSAALVTRAALEVADGFDPALRDNNAQGCEDILFYCRVAEHYAFGMVDDYQIGYRQLPDNMSSNLPCMLRSWLMVLDEIRDRHPEKKKQIHGGIARYSRWIVRRAIHHRRFSTLPRLIAMIARQSPRIAATMLFNVAPVTLYEQFIKWRFVKHAPPAPRQRQWR
ncbi:glycosyltransferase [Sphingobium sp. CAP-1]|nr:glycosyltransferase [Sphingobium sp. CAP-1]